MKKIQTPFPADTDVFAQTDSLASQKGYWNEGVAYEISSQQAADFKAAALSIVDLYTDAMDAIAGDPAQYVNAFIFTGSKAKDKKIFDFACKQWVLEKSKGYVLDRWDLAWDGKSPPKLLERNFGYLGLIAGTASVQEDYINWLAKQDGFFDVQSFGSLQSAFIKSFRNVADEYGIPANTRIALITEENSEHSDKGMIRAGEIINRWIKRAGYDPTKIEVEQLLFDDGETQAYIGLPDEFKTKWQWQIEQQGSRHFGQLVDTYARLRITQKYCFPFASFDSYARDKALSTWKPPAVKSTLILSKMKAENRESKMLYPYWSLIMGHKAMLPILFERNPTHPNLLPAHFISEPLIGSKYVVKATNSSQGIGSKIISEEGKVLVSRQFKKRRQNIKYRHIYQQYATACEDINGGYRVFHLFTTNGAPAALGARVAPASFVGGSDTQTTYMPVIVRTGKLGARNQRLDATLS